jgi:hypothetical protein
MSADVYAQVDRRRNLSREEFRREYLYKGRPVIIEDAIDDWKNDPTWTWEGFKKVCGTAKVRVYRYDPKLEYRPNDVRHMAVGELIDNVREGDWQTFPFYMRDEWNLFYEYPQLRAAQAVPAYFFDWFKFVPKRLRLEYPRLFIGPRGAITPLHVDIWGTHAWLAQLSGRKRWLLFSPDQAPLLYGYKVRVEAPDYERQPLFRQARPVEAIINPGDTIWVPSRWSHWVQSEQPGLSVTYNYMGPGCFASSLKGMFRQQVVRRIKRRPALSPA